MVVALYIDDRPEQMNGHILSLIKVIRADGLRFIYGIMIMLVYVALGNE